MKAEPHCTTPHAVFLPSPLPPSSAAEFVAKSFVSTPREKQMRTPPIRADIAHGSFETYKKVRGEDGGGGWMGM